MNPAKHATTRLDMLYRAQAIKRTLGLAPAIQYMLKRKFSAECCAFILARHK